MSEVSARPYTQRDKDGNALAPRTDASCITYGANNVQQVIENIIASGSAPYNPESTYALGAYCNQLGVMYKCTTAITSPEAWNAAHWIATTVAAELLAIDASLSNKVEFDGGFLQSGSIESWAESKTIHTSICTNDFVTDMPYAGYWGVNFYFYPAASWRVLIATDIQYGKQFYTIKNGVNPWFEWTPIATATPPTEYDLPLASGTQKTFVDVKCTYYKNQFSEVTVSATVSPTSGSYVENEANLIATLPAGYRPSAAIRVPAICCDADNLFKPAFAFVYADGTVSGYPTTTATQIALQVAFVAGN